MSLGGFTTNFIWCIYLNIKNKTGYQYFAKEIQYPPVQANESVMELAIDALGKGKIGCAISDNGIKVQRVPILSNYFFSIVAGITWYFQFFFYTMGETQMGKFGFASWTLHMASIIIFSTLWGWIFREWKGASPKSHQLITAGVFMLIISTIVIGAGTWLKGLHASP